MNKKESKRLNLGKINYLLLLAAAILLIVGYLVMSMNEINISPVILIVAYLAIIPLALLVPGGRKE